MRTLILDGAMKVLKSVGRAFRKGGESFSRKV